MEKQINFTAEHQAQLNTLLLEYLLKGTKIKSSFGANLLSVYALLHESSIETLKSIYDNYKSDIDKSAGKQDDWSLTDKEVKELKLKQDIKLLVHLIIGYRKHKEQEDKKRELLRNKKATLEKMKFDILTPDDKIKLLEAEIDILEKDVN